MSRWFRVYGELVDDPKFIKLGPDLRSALLMVWCIASQNDGRLPSIDDISIKFRLSPARTYKLLQELERCGFIDRDDNGTVPHNWNGRQYQSDSAAERMRRYRTKQRDERNALRNMQRHSDGIEQSRTDTDTESKNERAREFEEFWKAYPKREGSNPRLPASKKFEAHIRAGVAAGAIIGGARGYAAQEAKNVGTPYIAQAATWLNQRRWEDYAPRAPEDIAKADATAEAHGYEWNGEKYVKKEQQIASGGGG